MNLPTNQLPTATGPASQPPAHRAGQHVRLGSERQPRDAAARHASAATPSTVSRLQRRQQLGLVCRGGGRHSGGQLCGCSPAGRRGGRAATAAVRACGSGSQQLYITFSLFHFSIFFVYGVQIYFFTFSFFYGVQIYPGSGFRNPGSVFLRPQIAPCALVPSHLFLW